MTEHRLGTPVELPWWTVPLDLPPLATVVLGVVLASPLWARLMVIVCSIALGVLVAVVGTRVRSGSMQSVWISAAYAVWFFAAVVWAVAVATPACNCG